MTIVYVLARMQIGKKEVVGVFDSLEKASAAANYFPVGNPDSEDYDIEQHALNPFEQEMASGLHLYEVSVNNLRSTFTVCHPGDRASGYHFFAGHSRHCGPELIETICADNPKQAMEHVHQHYTELLSQGTKR